MFEDLDRLCFGLLLDEPEISNQCVQRWLTPAGSMLLALLFQDGDLDKCIFGVVLAVNHDYAATVTRRIKVTRG